MRADAAQLSKIPSGHEGPLSPTAQNEDRGIRAQDIVERGIELAHGGQPDGVADIGPVDGHDRDPGSDLEVYATSGRGLVVLGHGPSPQDERL
jgi:hypothetical protein